MKKRVLKVIYAGDIKRVVVCYKSGETRGFDAVRVQAVVDEFGYKGFEIVGNDNLLIFIHAGGVAKIGFKNEKEER